MEGTLAVQRERPTAVPNDITLVEEHIPAVPARILVPGRLRLAVAGAWKEASRTHLLEARAALIGLRRFTGSLREKIVSLVTIHLKSCQLKEDALQQRPTPPILGLAVIWRH